MIDGIPLVDVHVHVARRSTLKVPWERWAHTAAEPPTASVYDGEGEVVPERFEALLDREGVDLALLLAE